MLICPIRKINSPRLILKLSIHYTRISKSPIWDPVTGFGGDGVPGTYLVPSDPDPSNSSKIHPEAYLGGGCVKDGPFANLTIHTGPGLLWTEHCLTRSINDNENATLNSKALAQSFSYPTYAEFSYWLDGPFPFSSQVGPHVAGHGTVGGDMANFFSSAGGWFLFFFRKLDNR